MRVRLLPLLIAQLLYSPLALAQSSDSEHHDEHEFDAITVQADPLRSSYGDLIQPASVLQGEQLEQRKAGTLGDTLQKEAGVQTSFFGPAVGRPVIRGQDGARVQVLSEGLASMDVSTVSVDHAVTIEPFLADQIEVLRGPSTLLYGAGAVGGVVNVIDGRIPEAAGDQPVSGRLQLGGDTVADTRFGMARIETGNDRFVLRADAYYRDAADYEIPGPAVAGGAEDDGVLANSSLTSKGGAVGGSMIGERGFLGLAVSTYKTNYGVPGEEDVRLDMDQRRVDLKAGLDDPYRGAESLRLRIGSNDYEHVELEGAEVGTRFDNQELSGRLDIIHSAWGAWNGAYGLSFSDRDLQAIGEEAFVPPSQTTQWGLFLVERRDFGGWNLELGGRYDHQSIDAEVQDGEQSHSGFSLSAGASWDLSEALVFSVNLDRAARLPTAEELYSDGPHAATQSFEIGDSALNQEVSNQIDLGLRWRAERFTGSVHAYHSRFDDFIYLADTADIEDDLPVRLWSQGNARFTGFEIEGTWHMAENEYGHFDLRSFGDSVRARLSDGGDLPRIPQSRIGSEFRWHREHWHASIGATHYFDQTRTAAFETPTADFTLWDAALTYSHDTEAASFEWYLKGENLGDTEARLHTSVLKDVAPLPGRNLGVGVRVYF